MDNATFENLVKEIRAASMDTLTAKNAKYATDGDRLHNFVAGGDVMGGTAAQACWGYLTKHLVALRDKVERNDFSDREDLKEKCQDAINYIVFIWCIGNEERATKEREDAARCTRACEHTIRTCEEALDRMGSTDCEQGLGLSPAESNAYNATYRDMAKKVTGLDVQWDGDDCPGSFFEGAPNIDKPSCGKDCAVCWSLAYKGERAYDTVGGD